MAKRISDGPGVMAVFVIAVLCWFVIAVFYGRLCDGQSVMSSEEEFQ
jgi:hypothetical protein